MKIKTVLFMILLISLYGCYAGESTPSALVPEPLPTHLPRWRTYELALLEATVGVDKGLCEWVILGEAGQEIYVYALCQVLGPRDTVMSVPAVIYLTDIGVIESVKIPGDGENYHEDIRSMFPANVQTIIFNHSAYGSELVEHLNDREINGGPPLIFVLGTPMP